MNIPPELGVVEAAIHLAEKQHLQQSGGQGVCQIHKDGRVAGGLKYAEGQSVALDNIRRRLPGNTATQSRALIEEEANGWQRELEAQRQREYPSMPWLAYNQGGLDACQQVLAQLDDPTEANAAVNS